MASSYQFIKFPTALLYQENISASELAILLALYSFSNDENSVWPSLETIVKLSKVSRRTVITALKKFEDLNYITKIKRSRTSSIYKLNPFIEKQTHISFSEKPADTSCIIQVENDYTEKQVKKLREDVDALILTVSALKLAVDTSDRCKIDTSDRCKIDTSDRCKIDTSDRCKIDTSDRCKIDTSDRCKIDTSTDDKAKKRTIIRYLKKNNKVLRCKILQFKVQNITVIGAKYYPVTRLIELDLFNYTYKNKMFLKKLRGGSSSSSVEQKGTEQSFGLSVESPKQETFENSKVSEFSSISNTEITNPSFSGTEQIGTEQSFGLSVESPKQETFENSKVSSFDPIFNTEITNSSFSGGKQNEFSDTDNSLFGKNTPIQLIEDEKLIFYYLQNREDIGWLVKVLMNAGFSEISPVFRKRFYKAITENLNMFRDLEQISEECHKEIIIHQIFPFIFEKQDVERYILHEPIPRTPHTIDLYGGLEEEEEEEAE